MTTTTQHIIFDMDDTLIHCNKYFDLILGDYFEWMTEWFARYSLTTDAVRSKQIEIDIAGTHRLGFASTNFPKSLIATYRHYCGVYGRSPLPAEEDQLYALGMSVYDQEVEPYPGMVETLEELREAGHQLYLYTGGESGIQQRKIEQMKLADYFEHRIFIRQHKNVEALEGILQSERLPRTRTWMIGNSLRTDIVPALTAGLNSIYLKQQREWEYNLVELKQEPHNVLYTVSALTEVPGVIYSHPS